MIAAVRFNKMLRMCLILFQLIKFRFIKKLCLKKRIKLEEKHQMETVMRALAAEQRAKDERIWVEQSKARASQGYVYRL